MSENKSGYVKVQGVLKYNNGTREEMLRRNYWKDEEYTKYATGFGKYHNIETKEISPITEGKDLYTYTQDETGKFGHEINRKYIPKVEKENYESRPYEGDMRKWEGNYIENFNDNNKLGEIGDAKYLQLMTFSNYANSDRFLEDKYLTPGLISVYGSNPQIEGENGYFNVFNRVGGVYKHESGRIADITEAEVVKIVEYSDDIENNGGIFYLKQVLGNAQKNKEKPQYDLLKGEKYVDYSRQDKEERGVIGDINRFSFEGFRTPTLKGLNRYENISLQEDLGYHYDEKDIPQEFLISSDTKSNLLSRTMRMFKSHKINTMVSRFYDADFVEGKFNPYDTAISKTYGHSHGRNLLKLDASISDNKEDTGYDNPYCRTWTHHRQYSKLSDLIRPFGEYITIEDVQYMNKDFRATSGTSITNGGKYLAENTVLNNNGFVNITPISKTENEKGVDIKKCMFSIENLAWKDVSKKKDYISAEQQGPNGGRIMWFPPYDLDFQESVNVDWDQNSFIGRGEKVYTYKNTDRTGTLSFTLLIDHPNIINKLRGKEGMGEEKDLDADVLRFFAGCGLLDIKEDTPPIDNIPQEAQPDEPIIVPSPENSKHVKVYVYYPNNYSGNLNPETKEEWLTKGFSDEDWFNYLLVGKGVSVNMKNPSEWNGYEMSDKGLGEDSNPIHSTPTLQICTQWKIRTDEGIGRYHYRPDFDLRQTLYSSNNYKDDKSFKLNSTLNSEKNDGNYTFAEFWVALMTVKKDNFKMEDDSLDFIENLKSFVIEKGARKEAIEELVNDFSSKSFSPTELIVRGSATLQDSENRTKCEKSNSEMLADRRCKALACTIDEYLLKNFDAKCERGDNVTQEKLKDMSTVNSEEAKLQRFAVIEFSYNAPTITKKSEDDAQEYASMSEDVFGVNNENRVEIEEEEEHDYDAEEVAQEIGVSYEMLMKYLEVSESTVYDVNKDKAKAFCEFTKNTSNLKMLFSNEGKYSSEYRDEIYLIIYEKNNMIKKEEIIPIVDSSLGTEKLKELNEKFNALPKKVKEKKLKNKDYKTLYNEFLTEYNFILTMELAEIETQVSIENDLMDEPLSFQENFEELNLKDDTADLVSEVNRIVYNGSYDKDNFTRYETESEYFSNLGKSSPMAFNSIVEKFKYFSPAFHSISPEGFNARLNFLHQCTRQGHTIEASAKNGYAQTAGNLSFGRMPVCILRIGDFINTRIIINNLTINYGEGGGIQWDLNPEGAGVQPMYAKISMGIVILGGQSLEGPINRLQNAVSFDYYANTGVYDNRADRVAINNGVTTYKHLWTPTPDIKE